MAKFLLRGKSKFLEGKVTETEKASDGYSLAKLLPTEVSVEAGDLVHFGTENMKFRVYNTLDWRYLYKRVLNEAGEAGADYVLISKPTCNVFVSHSDYETTLTMYLKKR